MAIRFKGIEKSYKVYARPQDRLWEWLSRRQRHHVHVALTGVDFAVKAGETFGLVGENGAGKSTLLKIAAGTIRPTLGAVERQGRVAALLELGAGDHALHEQPHPKVAVGTPFGEVRLAVAQVDVGGWVGLEHQLTGEVLAAGGLDHLPCRAGKAGAVVAEKINVHGDGFGSS